MTEKDYDLIAACVGAAYKQAQMSDEPEVRASAIWDLKERLVLELRLDNPRFNSDTFISRVQYWYEKHTGY